MTDKSGSALALLLSANGNGNYRNQDWCVRYVGTYSPILGNPHDWRLGVFCYFACLLRPLCSSSAIPYSLPGLFCSLLLLLSLCSLSASCLLGVWSIFILTSLLQVATLRDVVWRDLFGIKPGQKIIHLMEESIIASTLTDLEREEPINKNDFNT